jgi:hypothetical protein
MLLGLHGRESDGVEVAIVPAPPAGRDEEFQDLDALARLKFGHNRISKQQLSQNADAPTSIYIKGNYGASFVILL